MEHNTKTRDVKSRRKTTIILLLVLFVGLIIICIAASILINSFSDSSPTPTPPPPAPSLDEVLRSISGMTEVQRDDYLTNLIGKRASYWSGKVLEVEEYGDSYRVSLKATKSEISTDIYLIGLSKEEVISIDKNDILKFSGIISSANYHTGIFSTGLEIVLRRIDLRTPTPIPSRTAGPTRTQRPTLTPRHTEQSTLVRNTQELFPTETNLPKPTISSTSTQTSISEPYYIPLAGFICKNVKVYYGEGSEKTYAFMIIGADDTCSIAPSGRGILVEYPNGTKEWKDRESLLRYGYVRSDDPFITIPDMDYYNCP